MIEGRKIPQMPEKITVDLGTAQKTLLLPFWGRAVESKKENPLLTLAEIGGYHAQS